MTIIKKKNKKRKNKRTQNRDYRTTPTEQKYQNEYKKKTQTLLQEWFIFFSETFHGSALMIEGLGERKREWFKERIVIERLR